MRVTLCIKVDFSCFFSVKLGKIINLNIFYFFLAFNHYDKLLVYIATYFTNLKQLYLSENIYLIMNSSREM